MMLITVKADKWDLGITLLLRVADLIDDCR